MRLEYMMSSTLPIQFGIAGRAEFRPASYPSKPHENAADFRLGPHDHPFHNCRILRGRGVRPGLRVHSSIPAASRNRGRRGRVLGRRDHIVLQLRGPAVDRFGFPALMAADAAIMVGVVVMLAFGYRDGFVPSARGGSLLRMAGDGILLIVRSPRLRALFPALFLLFAGWMLAFIYVPLVVARLYTGSDPATAVGIVLGAGGLGIFIASPAIGALADRYGKPQTLFVGCALLAALWSVPFFTRELLPFTVAWTVVNGLAAALFSVSFTMLSASATDATRGRVMTFAYLPANLGFVVGPAIGSLVASVDVFLVFPAAALLTVLGLVAVVYAWRQPLASP